MKEFKLELNGTSCSSCEKIIEKVAQENEVLMKSIDVKTGIVVVECDEQKLNVFKTKLAEKGYTQKDNSPGDPVRVKNFIFSILSGELELEKKLLNYSLAALIFLIISGTFYFILFLKNVTLLPILFLSILSSVITVSSYYHIISYKKSLSCMSGMMVGMTMGMISGFLFGAVVGATNGMFVGSVVGMAVGISLGTNVGRCCGIMGAMEGMMGGFMAGLMGAMTSVMLLNDNLIIFLYIIFGVCLVVFGGLSYMLFREGGAAKAAIDFPQFLFHAILVSIVLILVILYAPKSAIAYG